MKFARITPKQLKEKLTRDKQKGLALDIDNTLSDTDNYFIQEIISEFGNPKDFSLKKESKKYLGSLEAMPQLKTGNISLYLLKLIHSNSTPPKVPLIKDLPHITNKINKIIPIVAYITARPTSVFPGTRTWLIKHKFPEAPVVVRPMNIDHSKKHSWKAEVLLFLYPYVHSIVDDSPGLADELAQMYKGTVYLYGHTKHAIKSKKIIPCKTWKDVLKKISERHDNI